jgi:hypothetical protein
MKASSKNEDRDKMAVELYFSVLRAKKTKGLTHKEAKGYAYDAVELRFNISPKRLQNIIYNNHSTLNCDKNLFVDENRRLVQTLKEANASMEKIIEHNQEATSCMRKTIDCNNELIKVLEEVSDV